MSKLKSARSLAEEMRRVAKLLARMKNNRMNREHRGKATRELGTGDDSPSLSFLPVSNAHECASQWFTYSYSYLRQSSLPPWPNPKLGHFYSVRQRADSAYLPCYSASRNVSKQSTAAGTAKESAVPPSVLPALVSLVRLPTDVSFVVPSGFRLPSFTSRE